jgi:hypothetical protein
VARVNKLGILDTVIAVVPIRAVQALVTDAVDELVAAVADSVVANVSTGVAEELSQGGKCSLGCGCLKGVAGMVAVLVCGVAVQAEVVIVAGDAGNELLLRKHLDTAVASAGCLVLVCNSVLLVCIGSGNVLVVLSLDLGRHTLSRAVDDGAVLNEALDHPVAGSRAVSAVLDAGRAEIVVATVANTAVEVLVLHRLVAAVAVDDP